MEGHNKTNLSDGMEKFRSLHLPYTSTVALSFWELDVDEWHYSSYVIGGSETLLYIHHCLYLSMMSLVQVGD